MYSLDEKWQYLCLIIFTIFAQSSVPGKAEHLLPALPLDPVPHVWGGEVVPLPTLQLHSSPWRETLVQIHEGCRTQISLFSAGPLTTSLWYTLQVLSILTTFQGPAKQQALSVLGKSRKSSNAEVPSLQVPSLHTGWEGVSAKIRACWVYVMAQL